MSDLTDFGNEEGTSSLAPSPGQGTVEGVPGYSQMEMVWHRFRCHPLAVTGSFIFAFLVLMAVLAPLITRTPATWFDASVSTLPPSLVHFPDRIMGTDSLGHSVWSEVAYGARLSLFISVTAALLTSIIGVVVGGVSGYFGGWADMLLMRFTDIVLSIPFLPLLITISAVFLNHSSLLLVILIFSLVNWPQVARLVRGLYLSYRNQDFVEAARAAGIGDFRIIFKHIFPNVLNTVIVITTLNIASFIILESTIDFLGIGVSFPPNPTWGNVLSSAKGDLLVGDWWWSLFPGLFLLITVLSINFIGDGLRDALDVRSGTGEGGRV